MNKIKQLIIGSMLGDGYLTKIPDETKQNSRLSIAHSARQKDYLIFKADILAAEKLNGKVCHSIIYNKRYKKGFIEEYRFKSLANPIFTEARKLFYPNNKKVLNYDYISDISDLGFFIWFFDDAHKTVNGYQINTQCFSVEEIDFLRNVIMEKFDIDTTYQKFDNIIYIRSSQVNKTNEIFKPFMIDCLKYKVLYKLGEFRETPEVDNPEPSISLND